MSGESSGAPPNVPRDIEAVAAPPKIDLLKNEGEVSLADLLARAARRDQVAYRQFYDLTAAMVNAVALRVLGSAEDAEEVVSDVYLRAWRNAPTYDRARGTPLAWLLMMARSIAIDRLRQRASRPQATEDVTACWDLAAAEPTPEQQTESAQRRRVISEAFARLAPEQQQALHLAFYSGMSHAELAKQLGQPLGTVKTRIRLGLMHMKRMLEQPDH